MAGTAVSLELSDEESDLLQELLEDRHRTLLMEIAHTDHHHFKLVLRKKTEMVEAILSRFLATSRTARRA